MARDYRAQRPCMLSDSPQFGREWGSWQLPPILLLARSCSMPEDCGPSSADTAKPDCAQIHRLTFLILSLGGLPGFWPSTETGG